LAEEERTPVYYASGVEMSVSPWDFTFKFSVREGPSPKDVRPVATVIMSPQHAWVVSRLLARNVEAYEREIGKIELPPRMLNDLGLEP
jgi:hypothetical protein